MQSLLAGDFAAPRCAARLSNESIQYAMPLDSRFFPTMAARYSTLRAGPVLGSTPGLFQYERMMVWVESRECEVHDQDETSAACKWKLLYAIQRETSVCEGKEMSHKAPYIVLKFEAESEQTDQKDDCRVVQGSNNFFGGMTRVICLGSDPRVHFENASELAEYVVEKTTPTWKMMRKSGNETLLRFEAESSGALRSLFQHAKGLDSRMWIGSVEGKHVDDHGGRKAAGGSNESNSDPEENVSTETLEMHVERYQDLSILFTFAVIMDRTGDVSACTFAAQLQGLVALVSAAVTWHAGSSRNS